jgi:1-aminocyclopropane-1-carboxylate deaminase
MVNLKMSSVINLPTPLQRVVHPLYEQHGVAVWIKRDDLTHPHIQGNKWRKLKYNILAAQEQGYDTLLTFGGIYANHIYATAAAGHAFGLKTIGIIRGEAAAIPTATLQFATSQGMELVYMDRASYRQKHEPAMIARLQEQYGHCYIIPEGGTNLLAMRGVAELVAEIDIPYHYLVTACGTGGTLAGLIVGNEGKGEVIGISPLKGPDTVTNLIHQYAHADYGRWSVNTDYHLGGYARMSTDLNAFIQQYLVDTGIRLDPIYTSKMMYALHDMIARGYIARGSSLIAIHTGGMQGWCGFE